MLVGRILRCSVSQLFQISFQRCSNATVPRKFTGFLAKVENKNSYREVLGTG